jgi:zinc protease
VETIKAIQEEVEKLRTSEVTDEELNTAKQSSLNSLVFAYDTKAKTLGRVLTYEYYGYPKDFIQQYQKALAAVTKADILRVAKERLKPGNFTVVAVGNPQDFGTPLQTLGGTVKPIDLTIPPPVQAAREGRP